MTGDQSAREISREELVFRVTMGGFDVCMGRRVIGYLQKNGFTMCRNIEGGPIVLTPGELHDIANKVADVFQVDWSIVDGRKG